jgi:dTDP-4-dehydrorhamnose 3,5-epimerase
MEIKESEKVKDVKVIKPVSFYDFRGEYLETFSARTYKFKDRHETMSFSLKMTFQVSKRGVLRGLHGDDKTWKLIQCLWGEIFVAVADMRRDSATYLQWDSFSVSDKNRLQILIPAGCANGHLCLSEKCIFSYKQSQYYSGSDNQFTVRWDDPKLNISWPVSDPLLSERDSTAKFI